MSIHFLLSAEARTLSVLQVAGMSDVNSFVLFRRLRWGEGDEVVCPHCGTVRRHYFKASRQLWRCIACREDFSVMSRS